MHVFAVALTTVGLATVTLLTPAAYHRVAPRENRRQRITLGVRITIVGMGLLAVAIASSIFVVGRLLFTTELDEGGRVTSAGVATELAMGVAGLVAGSAVALWFVLPLIRREQASGRD